MRCRKKKHITFRPVFSTMQLATIEPSNCMTPTMMVCLFGLSFSPMLFVAWSKIEPAYMRTTMNPHVSCDSITFSAMRNAWKVGLSFTGKDSLRVFNYTIQLHFMLLLAQAELSHKARQASSNTQTRAIY